VRDWSAVVQGVVIDMLEGSGEDVLLPKDEHE
jgi:hypothetical protein